MNPRITIRPARSSDSPAITRLAALDSAPRPLGEVLLAEVDGEAWAALSLESGAVVADPFRLTTELVALLRLRAAQLAGADGPVARRGGATEPVEPRSARIAAVPGAC